jgi:hypothetical protein
MWRRELGAFVAGAILLLVAAALSLIAHDAAVGVVFAIGGMALLLRSFGFQIKALGPKGAEFEATKEKIAQAVAADESLSTALKSNQGTGYAAAAIRAAKTPQELANVLVKILDRPERKFTTDDYLEAERELRTRGYRGDR